MKNSPRYKRYDLGKQSAGTIVEIVLSCMNNVRLMDHANFLRYLETKPFQAIGGRIDKSPVRFTIPTTGKWHVVVDKAGFQTLANSNVRAIPPHGLISVSAAAVRKAVASMNAQRDSAFDLRSRPDSEAVVMSHILSELTTYKQIANTDVLTGLANRRAFDTRMAEIFTDPENLATTGLILSDIDHFKTFNDRFGHAIGDSVLRTVAQTIMPPCRKTPFQPAPAARNLPSW